MNTPRLAGLAAIALILFVQLAWFLHVDRVAFADGDSFLRLLRVERLIETGAWFDGLVPRANAPYGFELHWTRPLDVLMLAVALPMAPIVGIEAAVYQSGVWISPILHVATAVAMMWALSPLLGRIGGAVAAGLTATHIVFMGFAVVGRADHHMLFAFLVVVTLGFALRAIERADANAGFAGGVALAAGLWVGPEFLVMTAVAAAGVGMTWLAGRGNAVRANAALAAGLFAGVAVALAIERGSRLLVVEFDRISLFHLTFAAVLFGFWWVVGRAERRMRTSVWLRMVWAAAGVMAMAALLVTLFPGVADYPFAGVDADFLRIQESIKDYAAIGNVRDFMVYLGAAVLALPWLAFRVSRQERRWSWVFLALAALVFFALAMSWLRWSLYAALFLTVALADMAMAADRWASGFAFPTRTVLKAPLLLGIVLGPPAVGMAVHPGERAGGGAEVECRVDLLAKWLNGPVAVGGPMVIAAAANFGPELLYRTPHGVLATLSHRNTDGILDGYQLMLATDDNDVRATIAERGIDLIVLCPASGAESYFRRDAAAESLHARLSRGDPPAGITELRLPWELGVFRVFRTVRRDG